METRTLFLKPCSITHHQETSRDKWTSNSPALNRQAYDDGVYAEPMVKVLSLNWNTKTDSLSRSLTELIKETNSTDQILKTRRPLGICGTSDSVSENNDAGTMETQPNMAQRTS